MMEHEGGLILGMDFSEDYIQFAYFDKTQLVPVSVSKEKDAVELLIPTRLALRERQHEWIIGDEVERSLLEEEDIVEVQEFFQKIILGEDVELRGESYSAGHLMQIFIRRALFVLKNYCPYKEIKHLSLTVKSITKITFETMKEAMLRLDMKERYSLLDQDEAFLYYTIFQNKDRFVNDTAMLSLEEDGMHFCVLHIDAENRPVVAKISEKYSSPNLTGQMVKERPENSLNIFENLAFMALEGRYISTIYAVGRGFLTDWADEVLRKLSPGRHVFRGQNLFVKGACYQAREKAEKRDENLVFLGADRIAAGISILAVQNGREKEIILASPTLKWYEADSSTDVLVKGEDELSIQIKDFVTKKITRRFLSLSGINLTGNDLSRIRISIHFKDKNTCIMKAVDLGFGNFVQATNRVWELIWEK